MCLSTEVLTAAYQGFLDQLTGAGLLISSGVPGVYGHSGVFERVLEGFDACVTRRSAHLNAEVIRFPGVLNRVHYLKTSHIESFPDLMGSIHSFTGNERDHVAMLQKRANGEDWTQDLAPTEVMMTPATCYPLYPTATGTLREGGRTVDLRSFVFRHEPSIDPCRMQMFRMHESVRLGTPEQALAHRGHWITLGKEILNSIGLMVECVLANDPFFGRGGRMMAATQKEQNLKYEMVIPVATADKPTAIMSCNCHLDYFGNAFGIRTANGEVAHSACIGFGLERVTLALFKTHGFDPNRWPADVKNELGL
jgi:seryl-tRNA synthetase